MCEIERSILVANFKHLIPFCLKPRTVQFETVFFCVMYYFVQKLDSAQF